VNLRIKFETDTSDFFLIERLNVSRFDAVVEMKRVVERKRGVTLANIFVPGKRCGGRKTLLKLM
jgi:hypothetical protein